MRQTTTKTTPRPDDTALFQEYAKRVADIELMEENKSTSQPDLKKAKRQKINLRNNLVERNRPLVTYIVTKYYNKPNHHKNMEDLLQEGSIGLMSAIDAFDVSLGYKFSTYATWWIRQAVTSYLTNMEPTIHVPAHVRIAQNKVLKSMNTNVNKVDETFFEKLTTEGSKLDFTPKMMHSISCALKSRDIKSMETPVGKSNSGEVLQLKHLIPDGKRETSDKMDDSTLVKSLSRALNKLDDRKKNILLLRFNVIGEEGIKAI